VQNVVPVIRGTRRRIVEAGIPVFPPELEPAVTLGEPGEGLEGLPESAAQMNLVPLSG
jgi:hypothetical protein